MIQSKHWRQMTDSQIRELLADPNADETIKDQIVRDGMRKVQASWSPQEEASRRKWCNEPVDVHIVGVQVQLTRSMSRFLRRMLDLGVSREGFDRADGMEEE